jgi:hypothetical protein
VDKLPKFWWNGEKYVKIVRGTYGFMLAA